MKAIVLLAVGLLALGICSAQAQRAEINVLEKYADHPGEERLNTPADEIAWLRKNQLTHGELKDFPGAAIVLHRVDVESYLKALGFDGFYTSFSYGFTDPSRIYLVRKPGLEPFAVVRGLPGAGGITTQVAELHAMGATTVIHVGTCGLLSPEVPYGQLIVSDGSYQDGAAFLLERDTREQISRPDAGLTGNVLAAVSQGNTPHVRAIGFTMPIYYFQPASLLRDLLAIQGAGKPKYVEMEEAPFFALARLLKMRAASIVVGSDRLENHDGKLVQGFWDGDLDQLELKAFERAVWAVSK